MVRSKPACEGDVFAGFDRALGFHVMVRACEQEAGAAFDQVIVGFFQKGRHETELSLLEGFGADRFCERDDERPWRTLALRGPGRQL